MPQVGTARPLGVVIVSYECREMLLGCLADLARSRGVALEVVVVDNASNDGSTAAVAAAFPDVRVVANAQNVGFGRACNQGLRLLDPAADVLVLNPDTRFEDDALALVATVLDEEPAAGVVTARLVRADGTLDHACKRQAPSLVNSALYLTRLSTLVPSTGSSYVLTDLADDEQGEVGAVSGAFMLLRRSALDQVGLFDERFWMYGEDLDWCLRFRAAGWKVIYAPRATVVHLKGGSSGRVRDWRVNRAFHEAMWLYYDKHEGRTHPSAVRALVHLAIWSRLLLTATIGAIQGRAPRPMPDVSSPLRVALLPDATGSRAAALCDSPRINAEVVDGGLLRRWRRLRDLEPDLVLTGSVSLQARLLRAFGFRVAGTEAPYGVTGLASAAARPGAGLTDGPGVSVVVTVLNELAAVDAVVDALLAQLGPADELVVVDGGSDDGTWERLQQRYADSDRSGADTALTVVHAPGTNISAGRNRGIDAARNDVIATTDAGCRPWPGWLDALRMPFAEPDPPALVAGVPEVDGSSSLERAQASACYPDPYDVRRPSALVRGYTRAFGTAFDPRMPFARSLAFTRQAWKAAGGFPEDLGWVEDGLFGLRVAEHGRCEVSVHAGVTWEQRADLRQTFTMYRRYGIGASQTGRAVFLARDAVRAAAYVGAVVALAAGGRNARRAVGAGAAAYLSLPVRRAVRRGGGPAVLARLPLAMLVKDWGKVIGAAQGHRARAR